MVRLRSLAVAASVALAGAACSSGSGQAVAPTTTTAQATSTTALAATTTTTTTMTTLATSSTTAAEHQNLSDPDGRYPGYIRSIDVAKRTIVVDQIQFLTGSDAAKAATEDHEASPPPNDYYIRNVNPATYTVTLAAGATIEVNTLVDHDSGSAADDVPVDLATLAAAMERRNGYAGTVFFVTKAGGLGTDIEQQYLP